MELKNVKVLWNKGLKFVERKSFYVMLVLCVGIVVFAGLFVASTNIMSSIDFESEKILEENQLSFDDESMYSTKDVVADINSDSSSEGISSKRYVEANTPETNASSIHFTEQAGEDKPVFVKKNPPSHDEKKVEEVIMFELPVIGKIIYDYSMDKPIYSKTLNEWRTHAGVDIGAALGTPVKVAHEGTVKDVKKDARLGNTVVIEHENGLSTVYASLGDGVMVKKNQKLKKGEVIGSVGNSAPFEILKSPHLHFEVIKEGKNTDPKAYLPQLAE